MNNDQAISVLSLANIIEVAKRIFKRANTEDFAVPEGAVIEEDVAAAIGSEIQNRKIEQEIV